MLGPNIFHAPALTQSEPPDLAADQKGALYYIDTNSAQQSTTCFKPSINFDTATFAENKSYVLYHLFARNDAVVSYQLYVGANDLETIKGRFVRLNPHVFGPNSNGAFASQVTMPCTPGDMMGWCKDLPMPTVENGILTVTLDQAPIAADFEVASRKDYERCMPRDICYYNDSTMRCESCASAK